MTSDAATVDEARLVVLGATTGKRAQGLISASRRLGRADPVHVHWLDWLREPATLERQLEQPCTLRLEPPGDEPGAHETLCGAATPREHGELAAMDRWFAGLRAALTQLSATLAARPHVAVWNHPDDILGMTDKLVCQQTLMAHATPVPPLHGLVQGYDHLRELMAAQDLHAVFVKARYGSSAAGVVGYRCNRRGQEQAFTSARLTAAPGTNSGGAPPRIVNVKRLRTLSRRDEIQPLIDLLARQGLYAETWIPKPRHGAGCFDIRLVTLDGEPVHRVARLSRQVVTNLHLDAQRLPVDEALDPADQAQLAQCARQAARCFPGARMIGFDLVVRNGCARVLEANAFGDLLPGLLWRGNDTYTLALRAGRKGGP